MKSMDVIEALICANRDVATLRFFGFSTKTKIQDRVPNLPAAEKLLVDKAVARKRQTGGRFWEAVFREMVMTSTSSRALVMEALFHQENREFRYVDRAEVAAFFSTQRYRDVALNSQVTMTDGSFRHIPLLDFKVGSDGINEKLVEDCVAALGICGFLLNSGRSYHFIGRDLISELEIVELLAKFVLLYPIADQAWAAHQIWERSASLRVTARNGIEPTVVKEIKKAEFAGWAGLRSSIE